MDISEYTLKEISKNTSEEILRETLEEKPKEITDNNKYLKMITKYKEQINYLKNEFKIWSKDISDKFESIID